MAKKRKKAVKTARKRKTVSKVHKSKPRVKKPRKPKKPKVSAPLSAWANYDRKMSAWHHKVQKLVSDAQNKLRIILKHRC